MDWKSYLANTDVIVHCGGLSERWYPITKGKIPKPLTEIGKKKRPMLDWILLPYVKMGVRKFFITMWNDPEAVMKRCEEIKEKTGIEFVYLIESDRRMGKAGVVKHYLQKGVLDKNRHKLNVNAADLVNFDIKVFINFHISNGFLATMMGSKTGETQFDKLMLEKKTGRVLRMNDERTVSLPKNELANVGIGYFDAKLNNLFLKIPDNELPADWETSSISKEFFKVSRGYDGVESDVTWFPLKNPHDYRKVKEMDLEKWFNIKSADEYLGRY